MRLGRGPELRGRPVTFQQKIEELVPQLEFPGLVCLVSRSTNLGAV